MSYRTVTQTVFRIDAAVDAASGGRALCARPDCWADALTWLSPYCCPECARQVAGWLREGGRQDQPLPDAQQQLRDQLAAEDQMFREILAAGTARRRAANAERQGLDALRHAVNAVRRADDDPMLTGRWEDAPTAPPATVELHGSTPENRAAAAEALAEIAQDAAEQLADVDPTDRDAFALQPSSTELAALEQQAADQATRPWSDLPATPWDDPDVLGAVIAQERARREHRDAEAAKPRPRPRPPWWRLLARLLHTRKARR